MKRLTVLLSCIVLAATAASCGEGADEYTVAVRAALARTKRLARSFVYSDASAIRQVTVRGIVNDDYRYKVQMLVGGKAAEEEVAVDDALAARILDIEQTQQVLALGAPGAATSQPGGRELEALAARRWVLDPYGAPEIVVARKGAERMVGADPVLDGLTALSYVSRAIEEADTVARYNTESIEYRAEEDVFPAPEEGSGVQRFDTVAPPLPRPSRSGAGAAQGAPQASHFRRMAIYVKDGAVVDVREVIAPTRRQLEHLEEFYEIHPRSPDLRQAGEDAIAALNRLRAGAGEQQIRTRTMSLELFDLGRTHDIALPSGAIPGNLDVLSGRGRKSLQG